MAVSVKKILEKSPEEIDDEFLKYISGGELTSNETMAAIVGAAGLTPAVVGIGLGIAGIVYKAKADKIMKQRQKNKEYEPLEHGIMRNLDGVSMVERSDYQNYAEDSKRLLKGAAALVAVTGLTESSLALGYLAGKSHKN